MKYLVRLVALALFLALALQATPASALSCSAGSCSTTCSGGCACISSSTDPSDCACLCNEVLMESFSKPDLDPKDIGSKPPKGIGASGPAACLRQMKSKLAVSFEAASKETINRVASQFCKRRR